MVNRLLNSLLAGGRTFLVAIAGAVLSAALLALNNVHPSGLAGIAWSVVGFSTVAAVIKAIMRAIGYDPNKDPLATGPSVPLSTVPTESVAATVAAAAPVKKP